jgi:hypothetical protein
LVIGHSSLVIDRRLFTKDKGFRIQNRKSKIQNSSKRGSWLLQELRFLWGIFSAQNRIPVGKASEALNHFQMFDGVGVGTLRFRIFCKLKANYLINLSHEPQGNDIQQFPQQTEMPVLREPAISVNCGNFAAIQPPTTLSETVLRPLQIANRRGLMTNDAPEPETELVPLTDVRTSPESGNQSRERLHWHLPHSAG